MICLVALVVSSILAIFSATHRRIAAQAFDCVFRKVTLRPCTSNLNDELKARITGPLLRWNPRIGRHVLKRFEVYSWILVILTVLSIAGLAQGGVNYYLYGNCNGLAGGLCLFDPVAGSTSEIHEACPLGTGLLDTPEVFLEMIPAFDELSVGSGPRVVEFGCYVCEYTRRSEDAARIIREEEISRFTFLPVTIPNHEYSDELREAALCAAIDGRFWDAHEYLMTHEPDGDTVDAMISDLSLPESVRTCIDTNGSALLISEIDALIEESGIAGTPTFVTEERTLTGPQRSWVLRRTIR